MNSTQNDMLLNEIVSNESIERQWSQWCAAAEADPALWRRLAEAQRDELALVRSMNCAASIADDVDAPDPDDVEIETIHGVHADGPRRSFFTWAGWALAATVMIVGGVWKMQMQSAHTAQSTSTPNINTASLVPTTDDLRKQWLETGKEQGTVIGELPQRIVLEARPAENGIGYEVTFVRQIQERMRVPDLYQMVGRDDTGRPQLVSYEPPAGNPM